MNERGQPRLLSYDPNPVLARIYRTFFDHIEVDEAWLRAVREADARGTVTVQVSGSAVPCRSIRT